MSEKNLIRILNGFLVVNCLYLLITIFVSSNAMADDLEHIHAAWLVWNKQIPYTDFFEHHHPLMWWIFAPLVGLLSGNTLVFFVMRLVVCGVSLLTLYVVYRLVKDFLTESDRVAALTAVNIACFSSTVLGAMVQFKPDAFMHLFFWCGLYCFYDFLQNGRQKSLNFCAIFWSLAFCFLQTVIFLLLPLFPALIYFMAKKQITFSRICRALPYGVGVLGIFFGVMLWQGNLQRYYELNWVVNSEIYAFLDKAVTDYGSLYGILLLGIGALICVLLWRRNRFTAIFMCLYLGELAFRTLYISIGLYYFKMLLMYNAVLLALALSCFYRHYQRIGYVMSIIGVICCGKFWLFEDVGSVNSLTILGVITHITNNSTPNDVVLGTAKMPFGLFNKNPHYYWFSWDYIGRIDENLYHYAESFDINEILRQKRPLYVYYEDNLKKNSPAVGVYGIAPQILNRDYQTDVYTTLYKLKGI
jgi:hypothetical protein